MSDPRSQGTEHDTMVITTGGPSGQPYQGPQYPGQPYPGQQPYGAAGGVGGQWATGVAGAPGPVAPQGEDAAYWQAKYRRQRTWLGVIAGMALLALLGVVGLGFAAYQAVTSNPIVAAAQDLGRQLQGGTGSDEQSPALPGGGDQQSPSLPQGDGQQAPQDAPSVPGGTGIPLPEQLQGLGQALGVTDVGQLLDMAVQNGLMSQEQADQLRAALKAGKAMGDLGQGLGLGGADGSQGGPAQGGTTPES